MQDARWVWRGGPGLQKRVRDGHNPPTAVIPPSILQHHFQTAIDMPDLDNAHGATAPDLSQKLPRLIPRKKSAQAQPPSEPPPETPPLPPPPALTADHSFTKPTRRILSQKDHEL